MKFFLVRVKEGFGYPASVIVQAKSEEEAPEAYWLHRSMQNPTAPLEITESTAEAYAEQMARLGRAVTGV